MSGYQHSNRMEIINTATESILNGLKEGKNISLQHETIVNLLANMGHRFTRRTTNEYVRDIIEEVRRRQNSGT